MKLIGLATTLFFLACAPDTRPPAVGGLACAIRVDGVCGDLAWLSDVKSPGGGVLEVTWRSVPQEHSLRVEIKMDCCGGIAPCQVVIEKVDALRERISGIRATGGDWTVRVDAVNAAGESLGQGEAKFSI